MTCSHDSGRPTHGVSHGERGTKNKNKAHQVFKFRCTVVRYEVPKQPIGQKVNKKEHKPRLHQQHPAARPPQHIPWLKTQTRVKRVDLRFHPHAAFSTAHRFQHFAREKVYGISCIPKTHTFRSHIDVTDSPPSPSPGDAQRRRARERKKQKCIYLGRPESRRSTLHGLTTAVKQRTATTRQAGQEGTSYESGRRKSV